MPKIAIDYSKIVIYKIVCNDLNVKDLYVGSTIDFRKRKYSHKSTCNNTADKNYHLHIYKKIREYGGWENWSMLEIEKFSCKDGNEARSRERVWFDELTATMNSQKPLITQEEKKEEYKEYNIVYWEKHKEELKQQNKEYYQKHKEEIQKQNKKYYEEHKEQRKKTDSKYYLEHKEQQKINNAKWRAEHAEEIKQKKKIYYEKNKEEINRRKKEKK